MKEQHNPRGSYRIMNKAGFLRATVRILLALLFEHGGFLVASVTGTAQYVLLCALAIGMGGKFDFDAGLNFGPVGGFKQFGFESAELLLGGACDVTGFAFPQELEVVFADHATIHDPDAFGLAVFGFHHFHHVFDGAHLGGSFPVRRDRVGVEAIWRPSAKTRRPFPLS